MYRYRLQHEDSLAKHSRTFFPRAYNFCTLVLFEHIYSTKNRFPPVVLASYPVREQLATPLTIVLLLHMWACIVSCFFSFFGGGGTTKLPNKSHVEDYSYLQVPGHSLAYF